MVFFMPGETQGAARAAHASRHPSDPDEALTPRQIVEHLDRYIVGQGRAKRAVAIALRNRIRRLRLPAEMAQEVAPKNIIMIGPTGVGKTEIARRLARLTGSPFLKVEATKFTEVGYVGRDVESMVRDLVDMAVDRLRQERAARVRGQAAANVEQRLLALLLPVSGAATRTAGHAAGGEAPAGDASYARTREILRGQLAEGTLDDRLVEVDVQSASGSMPFRVFTQQGTEEINVNFKDMLPGLFGAGTRRRRLTVAEAREVLQKEEEDRLVDMEQVSRDAVSRVEQSGIVFLDEIDKIAGRGGGAGPDVSREGVQRDLLPLVEGTLVNTKHGMVRTDHVLFIASGAFHASRPSDLMPELQGRFPIRVELDPLSKEEFVRILTEPENALVKQYAALMEADGVTLDVTRDGVEALADYAAQVNERTENIGARRLHTIMERVLEDLLFEAPELPQRRQIVDAAFVRRKLADVAEDRDLSRYIL